LFEKKRYGQSDGISNAANTGGTVALNFLSKEERM
jgi:hypothetical protein